MAAIMLVNAGLLEAAAAELTWRVANRLPLLAESQFKELEATWDQLPSPSMHQFLTTRMQQKAQKGEQRAFLLADPRQLPPLASEGSSDNRPVKVELQASGVAPCSWLIEPAPSSPPRNGECVTTTEIRRGEAFDVRVVDAAGQTARAVVQTKELVLVGMGDSYSSGEGNPDRPAIYPSNRPTPPRNDWFLDGLAPVEFPVWLDPVCHRSLLSWPVLASLRVAFENKDATVRLIYTACSGATFEDGFFFAQQKSPAKKYASHLPSDRDGALPTTGDSAPVPSSERFLPRSQLNAVRDKLCGTSNDYEKLSVPGTGVVTLLRSCPAPRTDVDALMLTVGGNDVEFPAAVKGVLIPDTGRKAAGKAFMAFVRWAAGAIPPTQLTKNAVDFKEHYPHFLRAVAGATMVDEDRVVLLKYPNPIGPAGINCHAANERIKATFMTFGPAVRTSVPRAYWVVNLGQDEVTEFAKPGGSYQALMAMLDSAPSSVTRVNWLDSVTSTMGETAFDGRLLCTVEKSPDDRSRQESLEPIYFCQPNECAPFQVKPINDWNSELPGRRIINTTNDAVLAQRTWTSQGPGANELVGAMAGAFHPIAEAHAVAADSVYRNGLCKVLERRGVRCQEPR
jgi:hypothetical protein